ncbi:MAG: hypothetical protein CMJ23_11795 [Phycisphaerae bacterium]|nr:hypothetical protein [Phycisphaerae bacterium]
MLYIRGMLPTTQSVDRGHRTLLLAAVLALPVILGGCVSNPFQKNYTGRTQPLEGTPQRLQKKEALRRLGTSQFDVEITAGMLPDDDTALAVARDVGAKSYWWTSRPKFNARNASAQRVKSRGRIGQTDPSGTGFGEKSIKWFEFEAVFYADLPDEDED